MTAPSSEKSPFLRKISRFRWITYIFVIAAFALYTRTVPVRVTVIPVALHNDDYLPLCDFGPPTSCAFGHETVVAAGAGKGNEALACTTCGFSYGERAGSRWVRTVRHGEPMSGAFYTFSDLIANAPLPGDKVRRENVIYEQTVSHPMIRAESCIYTTDETRDAVVSKMRAYFQSRGIALTPVNNRSGSYSAYGRCGFFHVTLAIWRDQQQLTHVELATHAYFEDRYNEIIDKALNRHRYRN
ncbi:hypothetical protein M2103_000754 [Ereboglobus sp. PH5-5]|uniref:hypothetical protein n=1 Tax=Ereboglobus sp. PH5-5 TaxID=2940529 RepID=UPI00240723E3|nr:hypothetical protein [Ereboglobus sp. PH5-5]MDF9832544.1 hypothetical protein [Ereboglobus sp. PH5-5]